MPTSPRHDAIPALPPRRVQGHVWRYQPHGPRLAVCIAIVVPILVGLVAGAACMVLSAVVCGFAALYAVSALARDHALAEHGRLVQGRVLNHAPVATRTGESIGVKLTMGYEDPHGTLHTQHVVLYDLALIQAHPYNATLPLLIDPEGQHGFIAPTLFGTRFVPNVSAEVEDVRVALPFDQDAPPPPSEDAEALDIALRPALHTIPEGWWTHFRRPKMPRALAAERVTLRDALLRQTRAVGVSDTPAHTSTVDLSAPFTVQLSVWLADNAEAELSVTLRAQDARPSDPGIRLRTRAPQRALDPGIPRQQTLFGVMDYADFVRLWRAVAHFASLHGPLLTREVNPDAADDADGDA